ncbi:MAG: LysR family transcriptional regulator [Planctomycetaceae bacterium]|jgi:DNA-binding transcriptional LysR family regulator|nr:LysR family transcriptional regulator [Planctomycetaceae bacterium]
MNIDTIRVFCDVVTHQSFSRGAVINEVSQSAATQSIHRLEKIFGVPLIDRTRRPFVLTNEGKVCFDAFREIIETYDTLTVRVKSSEAETTGQIRIAAIYSVGLHTMTRCVQDFIKAHPKVKVHLEVQHPKRVLRSVLDSEVDFGLTANTSETPEIDVIPLWKERLMVTCLPDHPFASMKDGITLDKLNNVNFITFDRDFMIRKEIDRALRQCNVIPNIVMELDNIETIKHSIAAGLGVGILPSPSVIQEVENGHLAASPIINPEMFRPIGVIHRHRKVFSPPALKFIEMLATTAPTGTQR